MKKRSVYYLAQGAVIAALYVALTFIANALGLASGAIQVRFSEALTVLPYYTPAAVPGLFVGCLLANLLTGCAPWDVVLGSLATLAGAAGARALRHHKWLVPLPTILANTLVVPPVLLYVYGNTDAWWFLALTVGAGELISSGILGEILLHLLPGSLLTPADGTGPQQH